MDYLSRGENKLNKTIHKLCLGAMVSTFLVLTTPEAQATPPTTHPFYLEVVHMEQVQGELIVVYALKSMGFKNDLWDDYLEIVDIDTFDNSPEYSEPDTVLFSYAESPDLPDIPQKANRDELPLYINVYIDPPKEGYGRTNLTVKVIFDNRNIEIQNEIYFFMKHGEIEIIGADEWDKRGIHFSLVTTRYCGTQVIAQPLVS